MLVLASLQVLAQARTGRQALILPLTSTGTGTRLNVNKMAQVFTSGGRPSQCLAPIVVNRVDGENRLAATLLVVGMARKQVQFSVV